MLSETLYNLWSDPESIFPGIIDYSLNLNDFLIVLGILKFLKFCLAFEQNVEEMENSVKLEIKLI